MKRLAARFAVLCLLCLTACGKEAAASEPDDQPTAAVDWRTNGFTVSGDMDEEQQLWVDHYEKWEHEIPLGEKEEVFHTHEMGTLNGKIYRLLSIIEPPIGVARRMYLEIYDPFTRDLQTKEFQPLGLIDNLIDVDADLISETEFAYQMQTFETGGEEEFPLIWRQCPHIKDTVLIYVFFDESLLLQLDLHLYTDGARPFRTCKIA